MRVLVSSMGTHTHLVGIAALLLPELALSILEVVPEVLDNVVGSLKLLFHLALGRERGVKLVL